MTVKPDEQTSCQAWWERDWLGIPWDTTAKWWKPCWSRDGRGILIGLLCMLAIALLCIMALADQWVPVLTSLWPSPYTWDRLMFAALFVVVLLGILALTLHILKLIKSRPSGYPLDSGTTRCSMTAEWKIILGT